MGRLVNPPLLKGDNEEQLFAQATSRRLEPHKQPNNLPKEKPGDSTSSIRDSIYWLEEGWSSELPQPGPLFL